MKKTILWLLVVVLSISMLSMFSLAGCKEEAAEEEAIEEEVTPEEEEAQPVEKVTLVMWTHDHGPLVDMHNQLIEEYQNENPNVTVEYISFPWVEFGTSLTTNMAAGTGPDIFGCWDLWTANFADKGQLNPVNHRILGYDSVEAMKEDFIKDSLQISTRGGKIYGIPFEYNSYCLYINTDHFKEIELDPEVDYPKTWEELIDIAKKLVVIDDDGNFVREGFDFMYIGPQVGLYYTNMFYAQAGASWFNDDETECLINSPEGIKAMELIGSFVNEHKIGSPKAGNLNPSMGEQDFLDGQTSMMITAPWFETVLKDFPTGDHYIVVPLPQMEDGKKKATTMYGWYWTVTESSDKKDEAWKFIDFVSKRQVDWYKNVSFIQPRHPEWMDTPEAKEVESKYFDIFIDAFDYGVTAPFTTIISDLYDANYKVFEAVMYENANVKEAMDQLKEEVDSALKQK